MISLESWYMVTEYLDGMYWTQPSPTMPFGININHSFTVELKSHLFYKEAPDYP